MSRFFEPRVLYATAAIPFGAFVLGFIFWNFGNTDPMWAISSFVLVYDPDMRSAFGTGLARLLGTLLGSLIAVLTIYLFGLHKWALPASLAFTTLVCGYALRFQGAWRVVLVTVTLIVGSSLIQPSADLHIVLVRAAEVSAGSLIAIAFSWPFDWISSRLGFSKPGDASRAINR